jgi:hypothetical protein
MHATSLPADYVDWSRSFYNVRVRTSKIYLWGSKGVKANITFDKPLLLHIHNDVFGETITFGTRKAPNTLKTLGQLQPGECVSVPIQGMAGVFALCERATTGRGPGPTLESIVSCLIKESR